MRNGTSPSPLSQNNKGDLARNNDARKEEKDFFRLKFWREVIKDVVSLSYLRTTQLSTVSKSARDSVSLPVVRERERGDKVKLKPFSLSLWLAPLSPFFFSLSWLLIKVSVSTN